MKSIKLSVIFLLAVGFLAMDAGKSSGASDVLALNEAAIPVRTPSQVFLDAVATAGDRLFVAGEHGVIAYSDDNGKNWHQAFVPVDVTLTSIKFFGAELGWAAGNSGVVLGTTDRGKTWHLLLDGNKVNDLTTAAAKQASLENLGPQSAEISNAPRRAAFFAEAGPDKPFFSVLPLSQTEIYAFGANRIAFKTDDAGKTWQDWSLHVADPVSHHLYDGQIIQGNIYVVGEAGLVFQSKDGGGNFLAMPSPSPGSTLFGVADAGDGAILTYGVAGGLFRSTDKGMNWTEISLPASGNFVDAITLKSGMIVLANESGEVFESIDHGLSFQPLSVVIPMAVSALVQGSDGDVFAVGNLGVFKISSSNFSPN